MRVLMLNDLPVAPGPGHGGAEVVIDRLCTALQGRGHEVLVHSRPGPRLGLHRVGAFWDPQEGRRVAALLRSFRPDVIHAHNVLRELSPAVLWAVRRLPVVLTVHDLRIAAIVLGQGSAAERLVDGRIKQPLDAALVRRVVDSYVTVGPVAAEVLRHKGFDPVTVIEPPAPSWPAPVRLPSECTDLAIIGRVATDKGVDVALAAFARLDPALRGRLLVVGDGPQKAELEASAPDGVDFLGRLTADELPGLLATVRAVVLPSLPALRPETSSLTSIEAAWMGRPVVCSDDPAASGLVTRLGAGLVVPAGDVPALTVALTRVMQDDSLVDRLGAAGAGGARRGHAADVVAQRYLDVYQQALAR